MFDLNQVYYFYCDGLIIILVIDFSQNQKIL